MEERKAPKQKIREGIVVANKMQNTVTVRVDRRIRHPQLQKVGTRGKKYYAHSENNEIAVGDKVRIVETRPLSKLKRWRVTDVIAKNTR
ncbi:MAG: 30S ribosomal protein S17 [Chlamydiae bacterium]|nr:30S ribosomal protein S17 [Chlamydiota bacterium]